MISVVSAVGPGECHSCAGEEREAEIGVAFEAVQELRHKIGQPVFYTDHATEQPLSSLSLWSHSVVNCFMGEAKQIKQEAGSRTREGCRRTSANVWTHLKVPEIPCAFLASLHRTTRNRFQLLEDAMRSELRAHVEARRNWNTARRNWKAVLDELSNVGRKAPKVHNHMLMLWEVLSRMPQGDLCLLDAVRKEVGHISRTLPSRRCLPASWMWLTRCPAKIGRAGMPLPVERCDKEAKTVHVKRRRNLRYACAHENDSVPHANSQR